MGFISEWQKNDYRHTNGRIFTVIRNFLLEYGKEVDDYADLDQSCYQFTSPVVPKSVIAHEPKGCPGEDHKDYQKKALNRDVVYRYEISFDKPEDESSPKNKPSILSSKGYVEIFDVSDEKNPEIIFSFDATNKEDRNEEVYFPMAVFTPLYKHKDLALKAQNEQSNTVSK